MPRALVLPGKPWISTGIYEYPWTFVDICDGHPWLSTDVYGYPWMSKTPEKPGMPKTPELPGWASMNRMVSRCGGATKAIPIPLESPRCYPGERA